MSHPARLQAYVPGPVKRAGGRSSTLVERYQADPLFSMFGLDTPEYVAATLGGGTVTSIHRKLGDLYERCVQTILSTQLNTPLERLTYATPIASGDRDESRTADAYVRFEWIGERRRRAKVESYCGDQLRMLTDDPQVTLVGLGLEVRHCYQTGDSSGRKPTRHWPATSMWAAFCP